MGDKYGRLTATKAWDTFATDTTDNDAIWPVLDDADVDDVEDLFGVLHGSGPHEARLGALILLCSLFLPIDVPIEGNELRDRLLVSLRRIAASEDEHPNFRFMAEMNLKNARAQEILHRRTKQT